MSAQIAERISSLDRLEDLDAATIIAAANCFLGGFVGAGQALDFSLLLVISSTCTEQGNCGQQQREAGPSYHVDKEFDVVSKSFHAAVIGPFLDKTSNFASPETAPGPAKSASIP